MRALVWLSANDADPHPLGAGDLIGRASTAALRLDDPRVSEAHALVSLRDRGLVLLALRGRFRVAGQVRTEVELHAGVEVALADGITLTVHGVELPASVLGLDVPGLGRHGLAGTTSLLAGQPPQLRPGVAPDAAAVFWTFGVEWRARVGSAPPRTLQAGDRIALGRDTVTVVELPVELASRTRTIPSARTPIRIETWPQSVRLHLERDVVDITGVPGRILATTLRSAGPIPWRDLCAHVWPDDRSREASLRNRLDVGLARLRDRLNAGGATEILVTLDGAGHAHARTATGDVIAHFDATDA